LGLLGLSIPGRAQMASRGVTSAARPKPSGLPFRSRLTDVALQAGLTAPTIYGYDDRSPYIVDSIGCGIAFLDYDNDGWLDIFVLSGTRWEGAPAGATNRLYRNNRDGTFTDVTARSGLARVGWASGVTIADYNNDGFEDIFITGWGQQILYRNNGDGTFTDVTREAGLLCNGMRWATGCSFFDYDRDGHLDLFVARYVKFDRKDIPPVGVDPSCNFKGVPISCGPRGLPMDTHSLFHNNGNGTFTEVSERAGILKAQGYGLNVAAADFNGDGWPDIYVACDSTPSLLYINNRDGTFTEMGMELGVALSEDGREQAGMGLGIGDFNLDGRLDILKTHFTDDTPALYANDGNQGFSDVTIQAGLGVETRYIGWGASIVDLDNDGLPDLFWVNGSTFPEVGKQLKDYPYRCPRLLFRNLGTGKFEELTDQPAVSSPHSSRGCAFGDFDNDGDIDILIMNRNEPPSLLRNDVTGSNRWIKFKLIAVKSNRSAIGARVTVSYNACRQVQEVMAQSSFLSVNDKRLHFGVGKVATVDAEIGWPSGVRQQFKGIQTNRLVIVDELRGIVEHRSLSPA